MPRMERHRTDSESEGTKKNRRSKAGCLTCRIRRKGCHGHRDAQDRCNNCTHLSIQCLRGYGGRRPAFLKDKERVSDMLRRIAEHTRSQGMRRGIPSPDLVYDRSGDIPTLMLLKPLSSATSPSTLASSSSSGGSPAPVVEDDGDDDDNETLVSATSPSDESPVELLELIDPQLFTTSEDSRLADVILAELARTLQPGALPNPSEDDLLTLDDWRPHLTASCDYFQLAVEGPFDDITRPLVTRAIRLDVMAAITTLEPPRCLGNIRRFFQRGNTIDMFHSHMACMNTVVCVLAETSALSFWKQNQVELNMDQLLGWGNWIIKLGLTSQRGGGQIENDTERSHVASLFQLASILYVHSVIWGNIPRLFEIADVVRGIQNRLQLVVRFTAGDDAMLDRIVRSSIFPIFIAASLAREEKQFEFFLGFLHRQNLAGDSQRAEKILRKLRPLPFKSVDTPVPWREILHEEQMLLL